MTLKGLPIVSEFVPNPIPRNPKHREFACIADPPLL